MEMEEPRNGGGKAVTFDDAVVGWRRNGPLSSYLDIGRDADAGRAARPPLPPPQGMGSRRRTYADGELDVFAAERYFKGAMDGDGDRKVGIVAAAAVTPVVESPAAATLGGAVVLAKPAPTSTRASTASASASVSSAASATSQTVLLRGGGHRRRGSGETKCCAQVGVLMRTCSGKRSVRVEAGAAKGAVPGGAAAPAAPSRVDWYRELRMQKAALGLAAGDGTNHRGVVAAALPPSLGLGGTAKVAAIGIGRELVREDNKPAAELTCSSSRRGSFPLVAPVRAASGRVGDAGGGGKGGGGGGDDEENNHGDDDDDGAGSESSSDLFEIKSLMIDDCPYEPSEASVQWSVVTASAAGASERGDRASARWATGSGGGGRGPVAGRPYRDRPVGLLAGCASHRAVDVSAARTATAVPNAAATRRRSEGFQKARGGA